MELSYQFVLNETHAYIKPHDILVKTITDYRVWEKKETLFEKYEEKNLGMEKPYSID